ncbi:prominin-like protein [Scaptodrosophila lebanonensis]|uniref:Prominin-like protein n=1 Tax=Drosophila lebanonensis TaxID=7225 RepID=A0A6J2TI80_DROLE|nr:prominin-like protein [Scaptodrosophila lebanonensis]
MASRYASSPSDGEGIHSRARPLDRGGGGGIVNSFGSVANEAAGLLVSDDEAPDAGYIDKADIGYKASDDDWRDYFAKNHWLLAVVLIFLVLMLLTSLAGICYCIFCIRCRRVYTLNSNARICLFVLLGILLLAIFIWIILSLLATMKLNNGLDKSARSRCDRGTSSGTSSESSASSSDSSSSNEYEITIDSKASDLSRDASDHLYHNYVGKYKKFQNDVNNMLKHEPEHSLSQVEREANFESVDKFNKFLQNVLPKLKPLFERLKILLPDARFLAIQFRDALRGVKRRLMVVLTTQCPHNECKQFYNDERINALDMGCLHYDTMTGWDEYISAMQTISHSKSIANYPQRAKHELEKVKKAIGAHINILHDAVHKELGRGAHELNHKHGTAKTLLDKTIDEMHPSNRIKNIVSKRTTPKITTSEEETSKKQLAPRSVSKFTKKLGKYWYATMIVLILLVLLAPLLLLVALLVSCCSSRVGSRLLCAAIVALFVFFVLAMILVLFYLVHGALLYQSSCSSQESETSSNKTLDLNLHLPRKFSRTQELPKLNIDDVLERCKKNESLFKIMQLEKVYNARGMHDQLMKNLHDAAKKIKSSPLSGTLNAVSIYPEADKIMHELLKSNLSHYNSKNYTKHICKELVPRPLPGISQGLDDMANHIKEPKDKTVKPTIHNQATHLRAFHEHLGVPLAKIIHEMLNILHQIDKILLNDKGSFKDRLMDMVKDIKRTEDYLKHNATHRIDGNIHNLIKQIDEHKKNYVNKANSALNNDLDTCSKLSNFTWRAEVVKNETRIRGGGGGDECNGIAKPTNGIWLALLPAALLFLPAICLAHQLRCSLRRVEPEYSDCVPDCDGNYVTATIMPMPMPMPIHASTWVDCYCPNSITPMPQSYDYDFVCQSKPKRE